MKYEEWIQFERARLDDKKHQISERLRQAEERKRVKNNTNSSNPSCKGSIPPISPLLSA